MVKLILCGCALLVSLSLYAQHDRDALSMIREDAERLRKLSYMEYASRIDCNDSNGDNLSSRVCLNLKFQEVDSLLFTAHGQMLEKLTDTEAKSSYLTYHESWIDYRRDQAHFKADGYRGHLLGIIYLATMVHITENRVQELRNLLDVD